MAVFDRLEERCMDVVAKLFGDTATWVHSQTNVTLTALVCFKDATRKQGEGFEDIYPTMEYKRSEFPGLFDRVKDSKNKEYVTIKGHKYGIKIPTSKYDGDTIILKLNPDVTQ